MLDDLTCNDSFACIAIGEPFRSFYEYEYEYEYEYSALRVGTVRRRRKGDGDASVCDHERFKSFVDDIKLSLTYIRVHDVSCIGTCAFFLITIYVQRRLSIVTSLLLLPRSHAFRSEHV